MLVCDDVIGYAFRCSNKEIECGDEEDGSNNGVNKRCRSAAFEHVSTLSAPIAICNSIAA